MDASKVSPENRKKFDEYVTTVVDKAGRINKIMENLVKLRGESSYFAERVKELEQDHAKGVITRIYGARR